MLDLSLAEMTEGTFWAIMALSGVIASLAGVHKGRRRPPPPYRIEFGTYSTPAEAVPPTRPAPRPPRQYEPFEPPVAVRCDGCGAKGIGRCAYCGNDLDPPSRPRGGTRGPLPSPPIIKRTSTGPLRGGHVVKSEEGLALTGCTSQAEARALRAAWAAQIAAIADAAEIPVLAPLARLGKPTRR